MLQVEHISKTYGRIAALNDVSFQVRRGTIVGLLGSNGAGKSTLLRIIAGYLPPTAGGVMVGDLSLLDDPVKVRNRIGYMPEDTPLYRDMRVNAYLWYRGRLKGISVRRLRQRRRDMLALCGLESVSERLIGGLSRGYRQRLGLADALLHDPGLIMLDEPLANLDPNQRRHMRDMIRNLSGRHTVLLSSHILPDVDSVCTQLVILHQGRLLSTGSPEALRNGFAGRRRTRMQFRAPGGMLPSFDALARRLGVGAVLQQATLEDGWTELTCETSAACESAPDMLFDWAVEAGLRVRELHTPVMRLDDIFASLTGPDSSSGAGFGPSKE